MEELNKYLSNLSEHHDMYVSEVRLLGVDFILRLILTFDIGRVSDLANTSCLRFLMVFSACPSSMLDI